MIHHARQEPKQGMHQHKDACFNGGAIIDAQGREIPITEAMIQKACQHLENHWRYPVKSLSAG